MPNIDTLWLSQFTRPKGPAPKRPSNAQFYMQHSSYIDKFTPKFERQVEEQEMCYGYSIYVPYITYPFIATRTFDIESRYHSTYFLNISFNTAFHHLKHKNSFLYLLHFSYIRVTDQHSQTCRVECSNLYSNTFLKWQAHLKHFRCLKTVLNHYINFGLSRTSCYIPIVPNIVIMILTDISPVYL